jgi:hypothetical protein
MENIEDKQIVDTGNPISNYEFSKKIEEAMRGRNYQNMNGTNGRNYDERHNKSPLSMPQERSAKFFSL